MENHCTCSQAGWCERHQCHKTAHWHRLCRTRPQYFRLWEQGRGPGQDPSLARIDPPLRSVAVVIVSHNYGRYLTDAIESVLGQTRPVDEIVVVDDSSDDDTNQVACTYAH